VVPKVMRIAQTLTAAGIAKKVFDEARKPQNRARIRSAVEKAKARRRRR